MLARLQAKKTTRSERIVSSPTPLRIAAVGFRLSSTSDLCFYFARDSRKFVYTEGDGGLIGFEADSAVSIHLDIEPWGSSWMHGEGMIHSEDGTDVKFWIPPRYPYVFLNGTRLLPIAFGNGWMTVYVEAGTHELDVFWYQNPEPATAGILLVGALGILRRRKRKR